MRRGADTIARMAGFGHTITSLEELRALIPPPGRGAASKEIDHLDAHCRDFIARSPFFVLATADAHGNCDASPKGGPPGFVRVLDERRLVVPDYPGNRRLDSYTNILANRGVELLFLIPGMGETLRVRGRGALTTDPELLALLDDAGRAPKLALGVEVERCFLHCAKAFIRSRLWEPGTWPDEHPSAARIFTDHMAIGRTAEETERGLREAYEHDLWPS